MDYYLAVSKIYSDADFNPACFQFTEAQAREKGLWRDERPMPTQEELDAGLVLAQKDGQIKDAYDSMVKDVYDQMETTFGTRNDVSASAFASTYEAMLKRPASFVDTDLGLANEAAVTAYATSRIAAADAYGVFRMKRIAQYQAEKAAIEGA